MIRATTPTSEGWAQVFDTSGIAQAAMAEKEKRHKRFEDNIKSFDSAQVWHRDIPEFTKKVNDYYTEVAENYETYSNPSGNIEKYYELKAMENDISNFTVMSKAMGQNVDKASKLMLDKPGLYDNEANRALVDGQITGSAYGGLTAGYESGQAHNSSFMKDFNRNIQIDTEALQESMQKFGTPDIEQVKTADIAGRKGAYQHKINYNLEAMSKFLKGRWDEGYMEGNNFISSEDLKRRFGEFESFAEEAAGNLPEFTDPKSYTEPAPIKAGERKASQFDITIKPTTRRVRGSYATEKQVGGVKVPLTDKVVGGKTQHGLVKYNYPTYSQGGVSVSGTQTAYRWNAGVGGFDMDGATWSATKLAEDGRMVLTGVDEGAIALQTITFPKLQLADENGEMQEVSNYTVQKGSPLSQEMMDAIKANQANITEEGGGILKLNTFNADRFIYSGPVAYSQSLPNTTGIDLSDPTSFINALDAPGVRQMAMPWNDFKAQSTIPDGDIKAIESGLSTYNYEAPFAKPPAVTTGDLDDQMRRAAEEAARVAVGQ